MPDWIDFERAIGALAEWLGADERRELGELRKRDWLAEDRALEAAQRELNTIKDAGYPKGAVEAAARRLRQLKEAVARRNARVEMLAKSLPGALYRAVDEADVRREERALVLLRERFEEWQALGYIPSRKIAQGDETTRLMRERGWTHWHHLFTPRQLLCIGKFSGLAERFVGVSQIYVVLLQGIGKCIDWNSKPASCITSRRNLHTLCIPRHRLVRIQSPSRCAHRRERRPGGVCIIVTRCEEAPHVPIGPKSLVFVGRASPFARDLCNIRVSSANGHRHLPPKRPSRHS
ncbi:MAG: hypothetical protein OXU81_17820 [Gammaproteobacteria bacterium]|nr:hypothetical protein [Gammaproteobacteria bacterium]